MIPAVLLISFVICPLFCNSPTPNFSPPKGWVRHEKSFPSPRVKIGYISSEKKEFRPSVTLTEEKTSLSSEGYFTTVRHLYDSDPDKRFRTLGTLQTKAGTARLCSIDMPCPAGDIRLLQTIFVREGTAYLLTAAMLQEDFGTYREAILDSFRSFSFISETAKSPEKDR